MRFIQLGNAKQCEANGIRGWQFSFGKQTSFNRFLGSHHWECWANGRRANWTVRPEHATKFRFQLIMEAKKIPF